MWSRQRGTRDRAARVLGKAAKVLAVFMVAYAGTSGAALLLLDAGTPCGSLVELQLHGFRDAGVGMTAEEAERYRSEPLIDSPDHVERLSLEAVCALTWWYPLFQDADAHRATWRNYRAHAYPFRGSR